DTTGKKAGVYKGLVMLSCMDCSKDEVCNRGQLQLQINVIDKNPQVTDTQPEQARLFELIRQGYYDDAIAGFKQRLETKRGDSRDYYGVAIVYERWKDNKRASAYANAALKLVDDRRMSEKEVMDCERIAKLPTGDATTEGDEKAEQARLFEL